MSKHFVLFIYLVLSASMGVAQESSTDTYRKRADIVLRARLNVSYALPPQTVDAIDGNSLVYANSYECLTAQIVLYTTVNATNIANINTRLDRLISIQNDMIQKFTVLDNQRPGTRPVYESQWYAGYMLYSYLAIKKHLDTYQFNSQETVTKLVAYEAGVKRWYAKFDFTRLSHENPKTLTNLVLPRLLGGYLATELWPNELDAYGKPFRRFNAVLKALCLSTFYDFYHEGFTEIDAVSYVSLMATPVKMLGEYAQDTEVKRIARLSFQAILATISMDYTNGMNVVSPSRAKGVELNPTANNMHRMQWLFFGPGKKPYSNGTFIPNDAGYVRAMSVWMSLPGELEAAPQLLNVHAAKDSVITWFNDRQEYSEYEKKYVLPNYALASAISKTQAATGGSEGKNNCLGWRNPNNSTDFITVCVENNLNTRSNDGENPNTRLFQNQKTMIGVSNIPTTVANSSFYRPFLPIDYTTDQRDKGYIYDLSKPNWIFCHTGLMMYGVAFYGSTGTRPALQTQDPLRFTDYSHYFLLNDRKAAWILETADVNEAAYKGLSRQAQLNAFRDAVATPTRVTTDFTGDPRITYNSLTSGVLSLTYYAGATYNKNFKINGVAIINPYVDSVANSPYMRQIEGDQGHVIELGKKGSPQAYNLVWSGNMPPFVHPRVKLKSDKADFTYLDVDRPLILESNQTEVDGIVQLQGIDQEAGERVNYNIHYLNGSSLKPYGLGNTLRLDLVKLTKDTTLIFDITDPQGAQLIDTVRVYVTRRPSAKFDINQRNQYLPTENMQPVFTGKDLKRKLFDITIEDSLGVRLGYSFPDARVDSISQKLNVNHFKTVGDYKLIGTARSWVRATAYNQLTIHIRNIVIRTPTPNTILKAKRLFSVMGGMAIPAGATGVGVQLLVSENGVSSYTLTPTVSGTAFSGTFPIPATLTSADKVQLMARLTYTLNGNRTELSYPVDVRIDDTPGPTLALSLKAYLQGAMLAAANRPGYGTLMRDDLRAKGLLPTSDPYYTRPTYTQNSARQATTTAVLSVTGSNAIVDWVFVELRSPTNTSLVVATQSGLLQRDGDVVGTDGVSPLRFAVDAGSYGVVLRHRNHLGVMSRSALALSESTTGRLDFTRSLTAVSGTNSQAILSSSASGTATAMWAGDASADGRVVLVGSASDVNTISQQVLTAAGNKNLYSASYSFQAYSDADIDLNGVVNVVGNQSDTFLVSTNVLTNPLNTAFSPSLPLSQQIP